MPVNVLNEPFSHVYLDKTTFLDSEWSELLVLIN